MSALPDFDGDKQAWLDAISDLPTDELADAIERDRAERDQIKREHDHRRKVLGERIDSLERVLFGKLGPGEVAVAHSTGRVCVWAGDLADGQAKVRTDRIDALADRLPEGLRPKQVTVYPGVGAIRDAKDELKAAGLRVSDLVQEASRTPGLRWRTL